MVRYGGLAGNDHAEPRTVPPWSAAGGKSLYSSGDDDTVRLLPGMAITRQPPRG